MPIWSPTLSKPLPGTRPDPGKPLAAKLQGFYALNEGAGPAVYDAASNLTLGVVTGTSWSSGTTGPALLCNGVGFGAVATVPAALQFAAWPISVAVAWRPVANANTGGVPIFALYSTNSTNVAIASIVENSIAPLQISCNYSGTTFGTASAMSLGTDYVASLTVNVNSQVLYVNGSLKSNTTTALTTPTWSATSMLAVGPQGFFAPRTLNGSIYWVAWWNRLLTASEHTAIGAGVSAIFPLIFGTPRSYGLYPLFSQVFVRRSLYDRGASRGVA